MKNGIAHLVALTLVSATLFACDRKEDNPAVRTAITSLESEMAETNEPPFTQSQQELIHAWRGISVTNTPVDFQIAWSEALRAYAAGYDGDLTQQEVLEYQRASENLQIVAAQYVPEIRERRQLIEQTWKAIGNQ